MCLRVACIMCISTWSRKATWYKVKQRLRRFSHPLFFIWRKRPPRANHWRPEIVYGWILCRRIVYGWIVYGWTVYGWIVYGWIVSGWILIGWILIGWIAVDVRSSAIVYRSGLHTFMAQQTSGDGTTDFWQAFYLFDLLFYGRSQDCIFSVCFFQKVKILGIYVCFLVKQFPKDKIFYLSGKFHLIR